MKNLKIFFFASVMSLTGLGFYACGDGASQTEQKGKEYTSAYICPMHCDGSGSEEAGKCPECGMDYVKNENHTSDGHQH